MSKPKILFLDIETLPNITYAFDLYSYKKPDMIIQEKSIITFAYKWLGDKEAHVLKGKPYDDKELCIAINSIIGEADYIVAHYGDKFDMRFINSRCLINGVSPVPRVPTVDTYKLAKKHFHLNANRLDYLGKILGVGRKINTAWKLWEDCAKGSTKAINSMAEYNRQDVNLLESVFKKMLPYVDSRINHQLFTTKPYVVCPCCGSHKVQRRGTIVNKITKRQRLQCTGCGHWFSMKLEKNTDA